MGTSCTVNLELKTEVCPIETLPGLDLALVSMAKDISMDNGIVLNTAKELYDGIVRAVKSIEVPMASGPFWVSYRRAVEAEDKYTPHRWPLGLFPPEHSRIVKVNPRQYPMDVQEGLFQKQIEAYEHEKGYWMEIPCTYWPPVPRTIPILIRCERPSE